MKTPQEIAQNAKDPADNWNIRYLSKTAPGVAQAVILDALNIQANNFAHAKIIFQDLGIDVGHKRIGRASVPVVTRLDRSGGAFNRDGEGEVWEDWGPDVDLSAIKEWMTKEKE